MFRVRLNSDESTFYREENLQWKAELEEYSQWSVVGFYYTRQLDMILMGMGSTSYIYEP